MGDGSANTTISRRALRPLFFFLLFALLFHDFWGHVIIFRDGFLFYPALKYYVAEGWRAGRIYGWFPWQYLGVPFAADALAGWFYPLNVLFLALSMEPAYRLYVFIHYPLAAIFMDMFLRGRGLDTRSSLLGALAFSLSGCLVSQHANLTFLIGPALAPLALYCMDRALTRKSVGWALGAGAALALQVLGGDPQSAAVTAGLAALIAAGESIKSPRRVAPLLLAGLAVAAALLMSAVQTLPAWDMMQQSFRAGGLGLVEASGFSFNPARAVELIWPSPFGTLWPEHNYWGRFLLEPLLDLPWSFTSYLGVPVLTLAFVGVFFSRRRWKTGVGALASMFFLLAFGRHTPVFALCHRFVPLFDLFRYPEKYMAWVSGCLAVAAALGLETVQDRLRAAPGQVFRTALGYIGMIFLGAGAAAAAWPAVLDHVAALGAAPGFKPSAVSHLLSGGTQAFVVGLAAGVVLVAAARGRFKAGWAARLFIGLVVLDLYLANVAIMPAGSPRIWSFTPPAAAAVSPEGRPAPGSMRIYREDEVKFTDPATPSAGLSRMERECIEERATLDPNLNAIEGFASIVGYNAAVPRLGFDMLTHDLNAKTILAFNVGYIISPYGRPPIKTARNETIYEDADNGFSVVRLPDALPRAYWAPAAAAARDEARAYELFMETDLRSTVVISTSEAVAGGGGSGREIAAAEIVKYEPDEVAIECDAPADGWLVLSDRFYPGWSAEVDKAPSKIYPANVVARAVRVGAGRHEVRFTYRTPLLRAGAVVSIIAWAVALIWWAVAWRRRRKSSSPSPLE